MSAKLFKLVLKNIAYIVRVSLADFGCSGE